VVVTSVAGRMISSEVAELQEDLARIFGLAPSEVASGFIYDATGPVCPLFLFGELREHDTVRELIVLPRDQLRISYAPCAPKEYATCVPWGDLVSVEGDRALALSELLFGDLIRFGNCNVKLDAPRASMMDKAFEATSEFMQLPTDVKYDCYFEAPRCPNRKYAGYARQEPREFFQLRRTPDMASVWPSKKGAQMFESAMTDAFMCLETLTRRILELLAPKLGKSPQDLLALCEPTTPNLNCSEGSIGANVFRAYRIMRPPTASLPGLSAAATGLHADLGLLTACPRANIPGLTVLDQKAARWVEIEGGLEAADVSIMAGETLAAICHGAIRPVIHFVDEVQVGQPRFSMPFFLRARPEAMVDSNTTVHAFIEGSMMVNRPWGKANGDY